MNTTTQAPSTLLEAVRASLTHAARHNPGDVVAPVAVLWTDADGQWWPLVEQLRPLMPELLTLGEYEAATQTGPAIWLRCVIEPAVRADKFPDLSWPEGTAPVIYMPGVSRQTLRAVEECPDSLKPLVELQYRGTVWMQKNGKDWTDPRTPGEQRRWVGPGRGRRQSHATGDPGGTVTTGRDAGGSA